MIVYSLSSESKRRDAEDAATEPQTKNPRIALRLCRLRWLRGDGSASPWVATIDWALPVVRALPQRF